MTGKCLDSLPASWWPNNRGHAIVIPKPHFESIYVLPVDLFEKTSALVRQVTLVMKSVYDCAGTSFRQHNEPAGGQSVWHYHVNIFPRYPDDRLVSLAERKFYADRLKKALKV